MDGGLIRLIKSRADTAAYRHLVNKITVENLWIYVLALLSRNPLYGYELPEAIEREFGFRPNKITCYIVLYRLSQEGLIREERVTPSSKGPSRRYYEATEKGRRELSKAVELILQVVEAVRPK